MKRLSLTAVLLVLAFPVSAGAERYTILAPGETHRISQCYLPNGKDVRFTTYQVDPLPLIGYYPGWNGWISYYGFNRGWHAQVSSSNPDEGPPDLAWKTVAYNDGEKTVIFYWRPEECLSP